MEVTTTTPLRPKASLPGGRGSPFPVENREGMGEIQVKGGMGRDREGWGGIGRERYCLSC